MRKIRFVRAFGLFVLVLAAAHLMIHLYFYGTGIQGFREIGISGLATQDDNVSIFMASTSTVILFAEWGLILLGVVFVYAKHKIDMGKEFRDLKMLQERKQFGKGTELDRFYELLKDVKHFRLATAAKVFDVNEEVIEDWAKTLETSKFAILTYPRIGGPEIILKDGLIKKENVQKEKSKAK